MLTIEDATEAVMKVAEPLRPARRSLADALGCTLAEYIAADIDSPPFDKALVDGYAVRAGDLAGASQLTLGEVITAGQTPGRPLRSGEAALIMTGAPMPDGADAVVMIERTRRDGDRIFIEDEAITPGRNRLLRGREMKKGERVLERGVLLNAPRLGLLASVGRTQVLVVPRPIVAIVSTGDELVEPDQVPGPGQIRNSNATLLRALVSQAGGDAELLQIVRDDPMALRETLKRSLQSDVLLITGGVSAGTRDLVPEALDALGVAKVFHKVRLKPGKPLWFGVGPNRDDERTSALVFGLPGNPVSGIAGFLLFVQPALEALAASHRRAERGFEVRLHRRFVHSGDRATLHPSRLVSNGAKGELSTSDPLDWAGSADLRTVASADGFTIFPAGDRTYEPGEIVRFLPLG